MAIIIGMILRFINANAVNVYHIVKYKNTEIFVLYYAGLRTRRLNCVSVKIISGIIVSYATNFEG